MEENRKRTKQMKFYVSDDEKNFINQKMQICGIDNMGTYMRKCAISGKIDIHDYSEIKKMNSHLQKIGVNINQLVKRVQSTNSVYEEDVLSLKKQLEDIWQLQKSILSRLP